MVTKFLTSCSYLKTGVFCYSYAFTDVYARAIRSTHVFCLGVIFLDQFIATSVISPVLRDYDVSNVQGSTSGP